MLEDSGKLYYTISEVAHEFDVNAHTLRFWEEEFDFLRPKRQGNRRGYTPDDVRNVRAIYTLLKVKGMTIKGAKEVLASGITPEVDSMSAVIERLDVIRAKVEEMLIELDNYDSK